MSQPVPADQFLKALRASGLLDPVDLVNLLSNVPAGDRKHSPAIAASLVRAGVLTSFQARKLLTGASKGMVLGPYRILTMLGYGGSGKVYLARDTRTNRPVALKVLPPHKIREQEHHLTRFLREMEIAQTLNHPNVARAYDAGVVGDVHYIALEYVPGKTLSKLVVANGRLSPDAAARIFAEAADGLAHAHERGLIHRDFKPANVMITPAGHAKLLDLGLALRPGETGDVRVLGGKGIVVGTMDYVPPEQTRDASAVDVRSDLYGLGATMFFALTGRPPFPGGTGKEKIDRHRKEEAPRVDEYNGDVPQEFADLVAVLMSKDPNDRPSSAAEVRKKLLRWAAPPLTADAPTDLRRILKTIEAEAPTETDSETNVEYDKPDRRWIVFALAALVLILAIALWLAIKKKAPAPEPVQPDADTVSKFFLDTSPTSA